MNSRVERAWNLLKEKYNVRDEFGKILANSNPILQISLNHLIRLCKSHSLGLQVIQVK